MNVVKEIERINAAELASGTGKSWHEAYKHSAYIFIGNIDYGLTEGDIVTVFSQWGEVADVNLVRDKDTGKPKGFAFLAYEDQRSTVLAVDNFSGIKLLGRTLRVDHCGEYKPPQSDSEAEAEAEAEGQADAAQMLESPDTAELQGKMKKAKRSKEEKRERKEKKEKKEKKKKRHKEEDNAALLARLSPALPPNEPEKLPARSRSRSPRRRSPAPLSRFAEPEPGHRSRSPGTVVSRRRRSTRSPSPHSRHGVRRQMSPSPDSRYRSRQQRRASPSSRSGHRYSSRSPSRRSPSRHHRHSSRSPGRNHRYSS